MGAAARAEIKAELGADEMRPRTGAELAGFLAMSVVLGMGWEILYRGFLLLVLAPQVGLAGAVILSALAYGVAHGFSTPKQFAGSILSAYVFTIAYALTGSLWWLIVVHIGAPLGMGVGSYLRHRRTGTPMRGEADTAALK